LRNPKCAKAPRGQPSSGKEDLGPQVNPVGAAFAHPFFWSFDMSEKEDYGQDLLDTIQFCLYLIVMLASLLTMHVLGAA